MKLDLGECVDFDKASWPPDNVRQTLVTYLGWAFTSPSTLCQSAYWQLQGAL